MGARFGVVSSANADGESAHLFENSARAGVHSRRASWHCVRLLAQQYDSLTLGDALGVDQMKRLLRRSRKTC